MSSILPAWRSGWNLRMNVLIVEDRLRLWNKLRYHYYLHNINSNININKICGHYLMFDILSLTTIAKTSGIFSIAESILFFSYSVESSVDNISFSTSKSHFRSNGSVYKIKDLIIMQFYYIPCFQQSYKLS